MFPIGSWIQALGPWLVALFVRAREPLGSTALGQPLSLRTCGPISCSPLLSCVSLKCNQYAFCTGCHAFPALKGWIPSGNRSQINPFFLQLLCVRTLVRQRRSHREPAMGRGGLCQGDESTSWFPCFLATLK